MKIYNFNRFALLLAASAIAFSSAPALALDGDAFVDRLNKELEKQNATLVVEQAEVNGDDIILKGAKLTSSETSVSLNIGDVNFSGVTESGSDGYRIEETTIPEWIFSEEEISVNVSGVSISGLRIPATDSSEPLASIAMYERFEIENARVSVKENDVFLMENLVADIDIPDDPTATYPYEGSIERILVDLRVIDDPATMQTMSALGYETLTGRYVSSGHWTPATGDILLSENKFTVTDAASVDFQIHLGGYTPDFIMALQEFSNEMSQLSEEEQAAKSMEILGLLQQLVFHSASLRIEDASLTGRLLDFFAENQGTTREALINQANGVLPFMLAQLGNPDFSAQVSEAVNTFLQDPKSFEIRLEPAEPQPFSTLMAVGMSAPQTLPDQLGVTVTANQ